LDTIDRQQRHEGENNGRPNKIGQCSAVMTARAPRLHQKVWERKESTNGSVEKPGRGWTAFPLRNTGGEQAQRNGRKEDED
jgi:hypothetical protein